MAALNLWKQETRLFARWMTARKRFAQARRNSAFGSARKKWPEILKRMEQGEGARTEFRRGLESPRQISKALCAFANGSGGLLVLGVDDTGTMVGVSENEEMVQERLTNSLQSGCNNPITATSGDFRAEPGRVHWVEAFRQQGEHESFSKNGQFWVGRGRSTVRPFPSELQELFNAFGLVLTERQVIPSATVKDIDLDSFRSFMKLQGFRLDEEPQPAIDEELVNSSICTEFDGSLRPTVYGLMVFGRDPQGHPNTTSLFVQCARYAGTDRAADVLSVGEGKGRLDEQVTRAMGWFRSLGRQERYQGLFRTDIPIVPEAVVREALVNSVIHRDCSLTGSQALLEIFEDRVDVTSPGTLPNHVTVKQARSGGAPRSRNEMMANSMVVRRLMERRGRGWPMMRHEMRRFNGSDPTLVNEVDDRFVRVSFEIAHKPEE